MSGYHTTRRGVGEDYDIIQLPSGEIFHLLNQRCNIKGYPGPAYDSKYSIVQEYGRPSLSRPSQSQLLWLLSYDTEKIKKMRAITVRIPTRNKEASAGIGRHLEIA
jgi:hypothetical protein